MLTIYGSQTFNAAKVVMTAEELDLKYDYVHLSIPERETKSPENLKRHPLGKVPVIDHDGKYLFESNTICRYLTMINGSKLYSDDTWEKSLIDQWVDYVSYHVGRWLAVVYFQEFISPNMLKQPANEDALKEARGFLQEQVPVIENLLATHQPFIMGDKITIADTVAVSYFATTDNSSYQLDDFPNLQRWYSELTQRPSFKRTKECVYRGLGA